MSSGNLWGLFKDPIHLPSEKDKSVPFNDDMWLELLDELMVDESRDDRSYLVRDQKIQSLVRQKEIRESASIIQGDFFGLFQASSVKAKMKHNRELFRYLQNVVAKKKVSPKLQELALLLKGEKDIDPGETIKPFLGEAMPEIDVMFDSTSFRLLKSILKRSDASSLILVGKGEKKITLVLNDTLSKRYRGGGWQLRGDNNSRILTDSFGIAESALYISIDK